MIEYTERVQGADRPDLLIVVGLHFMGADTATTDRVLFAGLEGDYRFVFPKGAQVVDGGPSWFPEDYYDLDERVQAEIVRAVADGIAGVLARLARDYPDAGLPIVVGASQGGDLAVALAIAHPDQQRLVLAVAASLPTPLVQVAGPVAPLYLFHGTEDSVVPIGVARDTATKLSSRNPAPSLTEYLGVGHAVPDQVRQDLHAIIAICN